MNYNTIMDVYNTLFEKYMSDQSEWTDDQLDVIRSVLADIQQMFVSAFDETDSYWNSIYEKEYDES